MGKKDKKKGKGKEKTEAKTEKKQAQKLKKELASKGEEDIEALIKQFVENDKKLQEISEEKCSQPSARAGFSLCAHPHKDQLILFGGDYFNGGKAYMYNDIFFYNIKKCTWSKLNTPIKPPPRTSHQAICTAQGGGQMWIFGGEFASPTYSQFYHYKDLWVFYLNERTWEQVKAPNGPSARSGHRMIHLPSKKMLIIFGGFHTASKMFKYYNDISAFDLSSRQWIKIETKGLPPAPRSACQMLATNDSIIIYGGFSSQSVNKDADKGMIHTDLFSLKPDAKKENYWCWKQIKQGGSKPSPRCAFSMVQIPGNKALLFGGVFDEENDDQMISKFYNDLYQLDISQGSWKEIKLRSDSQQNSEELDKDCLPLEEPKEVYKDEIFTVTVGQQDQQDQMAGTSLEIKKETFWPYPRMKAGIAFKNGLLFIYGGMFEEDDRQFTLSDFYTLDIAKCQNWITLIKIDEKTLEWIASDSESEEDDTEEAREGDCDESDATSDSS